MGPDRLFGPGVVVDTMEVAALWSRLPDVYASVRAALATRAEAVGCHLSHVYPAGSSLYFTFLVRAADDVAVERAYREAWDEAVGAAQAAGATMTHHHGVGRLKAGHLAAELGDVGFEVLRGIKAALDPAGILNPGALLP
jgi:alkyldihydroxyacetonephosphate synthase